MNRYDAMVCEDCVMAATYGLPVDGAPDDHQHQCEQAALEHDLEIDCDPDAPYGSCDFSWHDCDWCGTQLGGTRHKATIVERVATS